MAAGSWIRCQTRRKPAVVIICSQQDQQSTAQILKSVRKIEKITSRSFKPGVTRGTRGPPGVTRGELRLKLNFILPSEVIGDSYCELSLKAQRCFFFLQPSLAKSPDRPPRNPKGKREERLEPFKVKQVHFSTCIDLHFSILSCVARVLAASKHFVFDRKHERWEQRRVSHGQQDECRSRTF